MKINDNAVVIIDGVRTPFVKAGGVFQNTTALELGVCVFKELLLRTQFSDVDEVIIGNTENPPDTANIARAIALGAGLPETVSAFSVHRNCASALESITSAALRIQSGDVQAVWAGGVESMSHMPMLFSKDFSRIFGKLFKEKTLSGKIKALLKLRLKYLKPRIAILEGLTDPFTGLSMGEAAEVLAREFNISRKKQDQFAFESRRKTLQAQKLGRLAQEITPVITQTQCVEHDMFREFSLEKLSQFRPYFDKKYGTVTAGNSCSITDGASALLMMSYKKAKALGLQPKVRLRSFAYKGCSPRRMGLGPVFATHCALQKAGLSFKELSVIEMNEAFSAQMLACLKAFSSRRFAEHELGLKLPLGEVDPKILNPCGGALALGHPVGATGSRLVLTLMKEMQHRQVQYGLATLCIGGGQGGAIILENI